MTTLVIQKVVVVLLLIVLLFNLSQRRHLAHGEAKRFASLYIGGLLLAFYAATIFFNRLQISAPYLAIPAAALVAVSVALKPKIYVFRATCRTCGARLSPERVLYFDSNQCGRCDPAGERERIRQIVAEDSPALGGAAITSLRAAGPSGLPPVTRDAPPIRADAPLAAGAVPDSVDRIDWSRWKAVESGVLCFIREGDRLLLIHKKRGLGAGKVNAPGGRVDGDETPIAAAVRETEEEVGLSPHHPRQVAELAFQFKDGYSLLGYVYVADSYGGELRETDEAAPFWCEQAKIPYDEMWGDDRLWLPEVLAGKYVVGRFIFDGDRMLSNEVFAR